MLDEENRPIQILLWTGGTSPWSPQPAMDRCCRTPDTSEKNSWMMFPEATRTRSNKLWVRRSKKRLMQRLRRAQTLTWPDLDSASDSDLDDPDDDLENYFGHFLTVDKKGSRIHKPLKSGGQTMPMCRVRGETFHKLLVTEAWASNTMACQRCFGKADGCTTLCTHTRTHGDRVLRCGRRCTLGCGRLGVDADERIHSCALHMSENISRDV